MCGNGKQFCDYVYKRCASPNGWMTVDEEPKARDGNNFRHGIGNKFDCTASKAHTAAGMNELESRRRMATIRSTSRVEMGRYKPKSNRYRPWESSRNAVILITILRRV